MIEMTSSLVQGLRDAAASVLAAGLRKISELARLALEALSVACQTPEPRLHPPSSPDMFAVPGWKLGELKTQAEIAAPSKGSKKRKRRQEEKGVVRGEEDVDALYKRHIEGVKPTKKVKTKHEKRRRDKQEGQDNEARVDGPHTEIARDEPVTEEPEKPKPSRKEKKVQNQKERAMKEASGSVGKSPKGISKTNITITETPDQTAESMPRAPPAPSAEAKLTPMQAAMRQKLMGARFRHLNQTLYTSPSNQAGRLFDNNPTFFEEYHSGFRQQVSTWPENPVDGFTEDIRKRSSIKSAKKEDAQRSVALPKTGGVCTVADMGCGDAMLAQTLLRDSKQMSLRLLSFDLHSPSAMVRKADIANLPLADGSVNVAILCLALMGTNWTDFIDEAWRVLHWKGELWVAEIKSRFVPPKRREVDHSVGKRKKAPKKATGEEEGHDETLRTLVDGAADGRSKTDVTAFVTVLKGRGFALHGDDAVDISNKMFVKLRFAKALPPSRGRNVDKGQGAEKGGRMDRSGPPGAGQVDEVVADEAAVLKPCLYKIR